jgi:hypothetical protein
MNLIGWVLNAGDGGFATYKSKPFQLVFGVGCRGRRDFRFESEKGETPSTSSTTSFGVWTLFCNLDPELASLRMVVFIYFLARAGGRG